MGRRKVTFAGVAAALVFWHLFHLVFLHHQFQQYYKKICLSGKIAV